MKETKAFPNHRSEGMDLRDYFAAKAMQAIMSNPENEDMPSSHIAEWAYLQADSMLAGREDD
jgi:hypothetical protein